MSATVLGAEAHGRRRTRRQAASTPPPSVLCEKGVGHDFQVDDTGRNRLVLADSEGKREGQNHGRGRNIVARPVEPLGIPEHGQPVEPIDQVDVDGQLLGGRVKAQARRRQERSSGHGDAIRDKAHRKLRRRAEHGADGKHEQEEKPGNRYSLMPHGVDGITWYPLPSSTVTGRTDPLPPSGQRGFNDRPAHLQRFVAHLVAQPRDEPFLHRGAALPELSGGPVDARYVEVRVRVSAGNDHRRSLEGSGTAAADRPHGHRPAPGRIRSARRCHPSAAGAAGHIPPSGTRLVKSPPRRSSRQGCRPRRWPARGRPPQRGRRTTTARCRRSACRNCWAARRGRPPAERATRGRAARLRRRARGCLPPTRPFHEGG